jgi:hypothetical protein
METVSLTKENVSLGMEMLSLVMEKYFIVMETVSLVMEMAPTPLVKSHPVNIFVGLNPHNTLQTNSFSQSYYYHNLSSH